MKVRLTVVIDVDQAAFGAEYGENMKAPEVREHIRSDIVEALSAAPYAASLRKVEVR